MLLLLTSSVVIKFGGSTCFLSKSVTGFDLNKELLSAAGGFSIAEFCLDIQSDAQQTVPHLCLL